MSYSPMDSYQLLISGALYTARDLQSLATGLPFDHTFRDDTHSIAQDALSLLAMFNKGSSYHSLPPDIQHTAAFRLDMALRTLKAKLLAAMQQQQRSQVVRGLRRHFAWQQSAPAQLRLLQELSLASDELRAVSAFLRDEHIRAKALDATAVPDAAKPAKAESPEALVPGKQQQNDQQSACFGEIQLSRFKDAISTIALVSDAAAAGTTVVTTSSSSIEYPPCWLWVCYGKRTECYPSWAPTQKTQPEQTDKGAAVTCVASDVRIQPPVLWTGHANGRLMLHILPYVNLDITHSTGAWTNCHKALGPASIESIALDCLPLSSTACHPRCWVGDKAGSLYVVEFTPICDTHSGSYLREKLHDDPGSAPGAPIKALLGLDDLMFCAGGSSAADELRMWDASTQSVLFQANCRIYGNINCFAVISWGEARAASVPVAAADCSSKGSGSGSYSSWCLLSGHDKGQVVVWQVKGPAPGGRVLQRLLVVGEPAMNSAIRGMAVMPRQNMLVLAREPSWLTLLPIPSQAAVAATANSSTLLAGSGSNLAVPASGRGPRHQPLASMGPDASQHYGRAAAWSSEGVVGAAVPPRWSPTMAQIRAHRDKMVKFVSLGELVVTCSSKTLKSWTAEQLKVEAQGQEVFFIRQPSLPLASSSLTGQANPKASIEQLYHRAAPGGRRVTAGSEDPLEGPVVSPAPPVYKQNIHIQSSTRASRTKAAARNEQPQPASAAAAADAPTANIASSSSPRHSGSIPSHSTGVAAADGPHKSGASPAALTNDGPDGSADQSGNPDLDLPALAQESGSDAGIRAELEFPSIDRLLFGDELGGVASAPTDWETPFSNQLLSGDMVEGVISPTDRGPFFNDQLLFEDELGGVASAPTDWETPFNHEKLSEDVWGGVASAPSDLASALNDRLLSGDLLGDVFSALGAADVAAAAPAAAAPPTAEDCSVLPSIITSKEAGLRLEPGAAVNSEVMPMMQALSADKQHSPCEGLEPPADVMDVLDAAPPAVAALRLQRDASEQQLLVPHQSGLSTETSVKPRAPDAGPPLLPDERVRPAAADVSVAVIREELQQLQLLTPQLPNQLLRLLLLQMLLYAGTADYKVHQCQLAAAHALVHQGLHTAAATPSDASYSLLEVEQDLLAKRMQVLKVNLLQYQLQQQGYSTASTFLPCSNWLRVICLLLGVLQVQAAVTGWQEVASGAAAGGSVLAGVWQASSSQSGNGRTNATTPHTIWAAACCLLCYWLVSAVAPAALMSSAILAVAVWLGWSVVTADIGSSDVPGQPSGPGSPGGSEQLPASDSVGDRRRGQAAAPSQGSTFAEYNSLSELPPGIICDVNPCLVASTMERTVWPVTLQQSLAEAGGNRGSTDDHHQQQQKLLLHSLPEHNYDTWLDMHAKQQFRDRVVQLRGRITDRNPAEDPAAAQPADVRQHLVLSGKVTIQQKPRADFVNKLQQLMQCQKGWQQQQLRWICYDPPMLLEAMPAPAASLSGWLLSQQQQQQQWKAGSSNVPASWSAPFASRQWPQVLEWLRQIAAALLEMHSHGLAHGGVQAASVFLVGSRAVSQEFHSSQDSNSWSSSSANTSHRYQHPAVMLACLSLSAPWQHAVTPGRSADLALAAPEVIQSEAHPTSSGAIDVYGLGMLMWQVATGWVPYRQRQGYQQQIAGDSSNVSSTAADSFEAQVEMYEEMTWCEEMLQEYHTTFPGALPISLSSTTAAAAAAATSSGSIEFISGLQAEAAPAASGVSDSSGGSTSQDEAILTIHSDIAFAARHGVLPKNCAVEQWLPRGFRELLLACCQTDDRRRPGLNEVLLRLDVMHSSYMAQA